MRTILYSFFYSLLITCLLSCGEKDPLDNNNNDNDDPIDHIDDTGQESEDEEPQSESEDEVEDENNEEGEDDDTEIPQESSELPECISEYTEGIEPGSVPFFFIKTQSINEEVHYWINTGANAVDGDEYILNNNCDTVCYYGGWINPECINNYTFDAWETVWPN